MSSKHEILDFVNKFCKEAFRMDAFVAFPSMSDIFWPSVESCKWDVSPTDKAFDGTRYGPLYAERMGKNFSP